MRSREASMRDRSAKYACDILRNLDSRFVVILFRETRQPTPTLSGE